MKITGQNADVNGIQLVAGCVGILPHLLENLLEHPFLPLLLAADNLQAVPDILPGISRAGFQKKLGFRHTVVPQILIHDLCLRDLLVLPLPAGQHQKGIGVVLRIVNRPIEPLFERIAGLSSIYLCSQHNDIIHALFGGG